uniref:Permeases of the major facilitator superfamily n=1 Tax=uncultured Thiotrichaceae bacterium TaxID=298394 RepID=A0A6S6UC09_9GAMM|nr:MAG: Permeases of the major facilitator superfamily [uncultured Thiotrichaceae bacterium]
MIAINTAAFWRATLALSLGSLMVFANIYTTQPLLPTLVNDFSITQLEANWSVTITTFTLALSLLVYGALSDALGRKNLMLFSLLSTVIATLALSFVTDYSQFLLLRGIQGFCLGGLPAIAIAYMSDEFSKKALLTAVGFYIAANTLGGIGGRLAGGYFGGWLGLDSTFIIMAAFSSVIALLFWWLLPSSTQFTRHPVKVGKILRAIKEHLSNPVLLIAYLIGCFNFMIFMNQYSYITFVLADMPYKLPPFWIGLLFLTYLSGTLASTVSGYLAARYSQIRSMMLGIVIFMIGTLTTLQDSLIWIVSGFFINAFGFFLCHSLLSSWVSRSAPQNRATASALYLVFYYLGASIGGLYLNPFWEWGQWEGVVTGSIIVLLITLSGCWFLSKHEK